jgi:hypothetical protein
MTSPLNGTPLSPVGDWVIAICGGKDFIGKPVYSKPMSIAYNPREPPARIERLSPVFELQIKIEQMIAADPRTGQPMRDQNGNPVIQQRSNYSALPVLLLSSIREVELPEGAIIVEVASLSKEDRGRMAACVAQAEQIQSSMRSADTGLSLVSTMPPNLPKPPGQLP